jgi:hypothetical protein
MTMTTDATPVTGTRNILTGGFALMCRHWRCLTWAYFFNLLLAAIAALPLVGQVSAMFNHSFYAQRIAGLLDIGAVAEAGRLISQRPSGILAGSLSLDLLFVAIFFLFTPAILSIYLGDELATAGNLFRIGFRFFWRMVRIAILFAILAAVVLGILFAARGALLTNLDKTHVERAYFVWAFSSFVLIMAIAFFLRLWFDLAQVVIVERGVYRIGRVEDRGVRHAFGPAWRLLRAGFWKLYLSCALTALVGRIGLVLALLVWRASPPGATFLAFVLAQIGLFLLLASRLWQRGVEVEWFSRFAALAVPPVTPLVKPVILPPATEPPPPVA